MTRPEFLAACAAGDVGTIRRLLDDDPSLLRASAPDAVTGLHVAVRHPAAIRLLLERGADPNTREEGDHALPLHGACGHGHIDSVRALLEAGSDVQGAGDLHEMDTIGWATCFADPRRDVVDLLLQFGARHHVFSAVALGDHDALRRVVAEDAGAIRRRLSQHEQRQTALHYCVAPPDGLVGGTFRTGDHYRTLALLIELGAELEATDDKGRTPMAMAMLRGDVEAIRLLHDAGARVPPPDERIPGPPAGFASSVLSASTMLAVADVAATVAWYQAIGFTLTGSHGDGDRLDWASVRFGKSEVMFSAMAAPGSASVAGTSLWFRTDRLDDLYASLKRIAMEQARAILAGQLVDGPRVRFSGDLYTAFYGQREISLRDPNGVDVAFYQPLE